MKDFDRETQEVTSYVRQRMSGDLPPSFVEDVMKSVFDMPQRRRSWLSSPLIASIATIAAAVAVVGIGLQVINRGGFGTGETPTPTASGSPSATATPLESVSTAVQPSPRATPTPTSTSECPGPPFTLDEVAAVPVADRPACFGSRDLTLVGWVFEELNPPYDCLAYPDEPMWLMCILSRQPLSALQQPPSEFSPTIQLVWVASDPEGPVGPIHFGAADGPVPINTWVEVTGHFDDPAAAACRYLGPAGQVECAGTLVLTAARPAEAPL